MDDLRRLVAESGVRATIHAYCRLVDGGRAAEVAELFTEDAVFVSTAGRHGTATGREAIAARMELLLSTFEATSHHVSNTEVTLDHDDRASARTYLHAWHRFPGERPDGILWGRYRDVLVRRDDTWLFAERTLLVTAEQDFPFHWVLDDARDRQ